MCLGFWEITKINNPRAISGQRRRRAFEADLICKILDPKTYTYQSTEYQTITEGSGTSFHASSLRDIMPSISQTTISPISGKKRRRDDDDGAQAMKISR